MKIYIDYELLFETKKDSDEKIPVTSRIDKLNKMVKDGHEIHIWIEDRTAFLHEVILDLKKWGCNFGYVKLGKPDYDIIVDQKSREPSTFFLKDI